MAIQKYEFREITQIIKEIFPPVPCTNIYCNLKSSYNYSMGLMGGNKYALKRLKKIVKGGNSGDDDLDFLSTSKYLYYNTDKKEY